MANIGTLTADLRLQSAAFIRDFGRAQAAVATNTAQMARHLRGVEAATQRVGREVATVRRAFGGLGAIIAAAVVAVAVRDYTRMADTMSLLNSRLKLVTDSSRELADVQRRLFEVSQETRTDLTATATLFQRVARARNELGKSTEDVIKFTRTIQQLVVTSGATAQEATNAVIQLSQGLASGQVRGEELRAVMEQLPAVALAAARGLNMTLGEFRDASLSGEVSARQFFDAIIRGADQAEKDFAQVTRTVGQARTQLRNQFLVVVGSADQASEATGAFITAIDDLRKSIASPEFTKGLTGIAEGAAMVARNLDKITAAAGVVLGHLRELTAAFAALIAYRMTVTFLRIAVAVGEFAVKVRTATVAVGAFNAIIKANPIGLLASAVAIGVGAFVEFSESKNQATEAAKHHGRAIKDETRAIEDQTQSVREGQKVALEQTIALSERRAAAFREIRELQKAGALGAIDTSDSITTSNGTEISGFEMMVKDLTQAIRDEERAAMDARKALAEWSNGVKEAGNAAGEVAKFTKEQAEDFQKLQDRLIPAIKAQREFEEGVKLLDAAIASGVQISMLDYNIMLETLQMNLDEATKGTVALAKAQKEAAEARNAASIENTRIREETQAVMNGARAWDDYKKARQIDQEVMALKKDLESAKVAADEINRLTEERRFLLQTQQEAIRQHEQEQALYHELGSIGDRAFDRIGESITQMLIEGKSSALSFRGVMLGVISEIAQGFIKLATINPLKNALFGTNAPTLAGGIFGKLFGVAGGGFNPNINYAASGAGQLNAAFADGGSFDVGPGFPSIQAGRDNRLVSFAARDGERVTVETPGMKRVQSGESGSGRGDVHMTLVNPTRDMIPDILTALEQLDRKVNVGLASVPQRAVSAVIDAKRRGRAGMRSVF